MKSTSSLPPLCERSARKLIDNRPESVDSRSQRIAEVEELLTDPERMDHLVQALIEPPEEVPTNSLRLKRGNDSVQIKCTCTKESNVFGEKKFNVLSGGDDSGG